MNYYYNQLGRALGLLKTHGIDLPYAELNETMRVTARNFGPFNCDTPEIIALHKKYRQLCLQLGLIEIGELFRADDCIPIV